MCSRPSVAGLPATRIQLPPRQSLLAVGAREAAAPATDENDVEATHVSRTPARRP